ncbi:MAG: hypothetical protein LBT55_00515 [Clostridiaceae bacterium]|jgi:hypothetical protein|nr:hypothetical protein [Clostridiaceae bacterium]
MQYSQTDFSIHMYLEDLYYFLLAFIYDYLYGGYIPVIEHKLSGINFDEGLIWRVKAADRATVDEKVIIPYAVGKGLNLEIVAMLKKSAGVRYLLACSYYDVYLKSIEYKENVLIMDILSRMLATPYPGSDDDDLSNKMILINPNFSVDEYNRLGEALKSKEPIFCMYRVSLMPPTVKTAIKFWACVRTHFSNSDGWINFSVKFTDVFFEPIK